MEQDWSDQIVVANLADEPALSDELRAIEHRVREAGADRAPHVVLNFSEVNHLNSSTLALMLTLRRTVEEGAGRRLCLCSLSDDVRSVLKVSRLNKMFREAPDPATAIASLQVEGEHG